MSIACDPPPLLDGLLPQVPNVTCTVCAVGEERQEG
jgi:hypothetical protein